jgi:NADPH-dependent 2,4-dienoyl-CoA reductase/sulfur reductase-like enzyme
MLQRTRGVEGMGQMAEAKQRRSESVGIICKDPVHSLTQVAIVGGGIEGLVAALALARRGFQVTKYASSKRMPASSPASRATGLPCSRAG